MTARRVLVTGASEGIGREVATVLAEQGAEIVAVARTEAKLDELVEQLPGGGHSVAALDVGDASAWEPIALDGVTDVVCAAGVLGPVGPVETYSAAAFEDVLRINVVGTLLAVQRCLTGLEAAGGAVVTFSGGGGTGPLPRYDAYATSKAAVVRLTENLAVELAGRGVRVNAVAPGFVATRMHGATLAAGPDLAGADYHERTQRELAQGGVPARLAAELVAFLLSEDAAGITGKLLSAQWDPWREAHFRARLAAEHDLATVRRIDDTYFTKA